MAIKEKLFKILEGLKKLGLPNDREEAALRDELFVLPDNQREKPKAEENWQIDFGSLKIK